MVRIFLSLPAGTVTLREIETLNSSSAECRVKISNLSDSLSQAKELHDKDLRALEKSYAEKTEASEKMIKQLQSELKESFEKEDNMKSAHQAELQALSQAKDDEISALCEEMKKRAEKEKSLMSELLEVKALKEELSKERNSLKVKLDASMQVAENSGIAETKYADLSEKYSELCEEHQKLVSTNKDLFQENADMREKYHQLTTTKESIEKHKLELEVIVQQKTSHADDLEREIEAANRSVSSKEEELQLVRSSASDTEMMVMNLRREMQEAVQEKEKVIKDVIKDKDILQESVTSLHSRNNELKTEKNKLIGELEEANSKIHELNSQLKLSATSKGSESAVEHFDREASQESLQVKESSINHQHDENASLKSQVDFLNSVIVDLQRKNEHLESKIEAITMGNFAETNGAIGVMSDDEEPMKPGLKQRLFCDICDVFDAHDTDDCPTQSSTSFDSQGIQHHGNRNEERPYCGTCEIFGHWTHECDDEETF